MQGKLNCEVRKMENMKNSATRLHLVFSTFIFAVSALLYGVIFRSNVLGISSDEDILLAYGAMEDYVSIDHFAIYMLAVRYFVVLVVFGACILLLAFGRRNRSMLAAVSMFSILGHLLNLGGNIWAVIGPPGVQILINFLIALFLMTFISSSLHLGLLFPDRALADATRAEQFIYWASLVAGGFLLLLFSNLFPWIGDIGWFILVVLFGGSLLVSVGGLLLRLTRGKILSGRRSAWALVIFFAYFLFSLLGSENLSTNPFARLLIMHLDLIFLTLVIMTLLGEARSGSLFVSGPSPSMRAVIPAFVGIAILVATIGIGIRRSANARAAVAEAEIAGLLGRDFGHILVDTDMGNDDVLALLFLLEHPGVTLDAITVVGTGLVHCEPGVRNVLGLLELSETPEIPVSCGSETPFGAEQEFPSAWRIAADRLWGLNLETNGRRADARSAPELIADYLRASEGPATVLSLGPLTNFAEVFRAEPELVQKIGVLYQMGGAVNVPGNVYDEALGLDNRTAEWNIYADPVAAKLVFETGVPITLIPLDATNDVPVDMSLFRQFEQQHDSRVSTFVFNVFYINQGWIRSGYYYLWDTVAAAAMTSPEVVVYETFNLEVVTEPGPDYGRTFAGNTGRPVRVAVGADPEIFKAMFVRVLRGP